MTDCHKCKKSFEEINLTLVQVKGKLIVECDECIARLKDKKNVCRINGNIRG